MDFETGASLDRRPDTVAWNEYRQRWIAFFADRPGGVIFAEADSPTGPWGYGRRIATHDEYNFYNIAYHPFFDQEAGRLVYFEGSYIASFSGAREKTPRYDYNQIMYRLALDDPRLTLPVAIYRVRGTNGSQHLWLRTVVEAGRAWDQFENVAWFALPPTSDGSDPASLRFRKERNRPFPDTACAKLSSALFGPTVHLEENGICLAGLLAMPRGYCGRRRVKIPPPTFAPR